MSGSFEITRVLICLLTLIMVDISGASGVIPGLGLASFLVAALWYILARDWLPLMCALAVCASILPIELALSDTSQSMTLLPRVLMGFGTAGIVWNITAKRLAAGGWLAAGLSIGSLVLLNQPTPSVDATTLTMHELEQDLARGLDQAIVPWLNKAMASNVGPKRLRQICNIRNWDWPIEDKAGRYGKLICEAVTMRSPEEGARLLVAHEKGAAKRLAADLFAEAGLWGPAASATHDAVKNGGLHAATNLWRWRAIKGKTSRRMETWKAWNAEMNFSGPAGAERSAVRVSRAPGELKQMHLGPTQRAVVIATRYREQFELSLPAPPPAEASSLELTGAAGRGFALEILDANKEWHKFQCSDGEVLNATSFCSTRFGNASVALSESLAQPLRQMRIRGEAVIASIEVTQK